MTAQSWQPCVYILADEKAPYRYWALASYQDGVVTRYSRAGQFVNPAAAAIAARDMSRMYSANNLTPRQEGTTFAKAKLPRGAFADDAQMQAIYAAQDKRMDDFAAVIDSLFAGRTDAPPKNLGRRK